MGKPLKKGQWATLEEVKQTIESTQFDKNLAKKIACEVRFYRVENLIRQLPDEDLNDFIQWIS